MSDQRYDSDMTMMTDSILTVADLKSWRQQFPEKDLLAVTAYDFPSARHLEEGGVDILHVGDTLGMVVLGYDNTTEVTMDDMVRHTEAVARARRRALITSDLPYQSYETPEQAVANAKRLVDAGADVVKMEGGREIFEQSKAVIDAGIPIQGHLGFLPQHILEEKVIRKKGKTSEAAQRILEDAISLQSIGVTSIVIEAVVTEVANQVTKALEIPTIGIASGPRTTGQIRVFHDIMGLTPWFDFPHVQHEVELAQQLQRAVGTLRERIKKEKEEA